MLQLKSHQSSNTHSCPPLNFLWERIPRCSCKLVPPGYTLPNLWLEQWLAIPCKGVRAPFLKQLGHDLWISYQLL